MYKVAARVAAWIEMLIMPIGWRKVTVAARVAAWIEINRLEKERRCKMSPPVWRRGLKYQESGKENQCVCRRPCGGVD